MIKKAAIVTLLGVLTSGCATQTYLISPEAGSTITSETPTDHSEMQTFFVGGLGQEQQVDAAAECGGQEKVAGVQTQFTPLNWVLGFVSSGIYTPRQIRVYCK